MKEDLQYEELVAFHGHSCPGLAIGYRMTKAALMFLGVDRAKDEELVAIVENDACGVDALQYISGCTFGKGNLVLRDYGKSAYTLYNRRSGRAVRVLFDRGRVPEDLLGDRDRFRDWLLTVPDEKILDVRGVRMQEPTRAVIRDSVRCDRCGELVMETRTREENGMTLCIPCSKTRDSA